MGQDGQAQVTAVKGDSREEQTENERKRSAKLTRKRRKKV
jgi:hypothetical protein